MIKLSIVTISYNQKRFLAECIDSVLGQGYPGLEYIVVDPGSTDGSREIISAHDRIIKILEDDSGPADGLNRGFSRASGEIFGYLNSDDILLPDCLGNVADIFEKNPDIDVVYGNCFMIDEHSQVFRRCYSDTFSLTAAAYGTAMIVQPSTFFRRSVFEKVGGFNIKNDCNWDAELLVDLVLAGAKTLRVNQFWSGFRIHEGSITGSGRLAALNALYRHEIIKKVKGRPWAPRDDLIRQLMRIRKHLSNPRATFERVLHGPISGKAVNKTARWPTIGRVFLSAAGLALPWTLRRILLIKTFGYQIHPTSRIGWAWVMPKKLHMDEFSRIGDFTVCKGMDLVHLGRYSTIGKGNWISGYPAERLGHYGDQAGRISELVVGEHSAITSLHIIDCTNSVVLGRFSIFAGYRSQILTHSIDMASSRQMSTPVRIGNYCFVGTGSVILGGSSLPDYSVLGAMALLNKPYTQCYTLYGGVPAKPVKTLPSDMQYYKRKVGFVN